MKTLFTILNTLYSTTFLPRLVLLAPRHHHSTPLLVKLHWLPILECIKYKVACMCFSAINGSGSAYLSELLHVYTPSRTLRSSSDTRMLVCVSVCVSVCACELDKNTVQCECCLTWTRGSVQSECCI